MDDVSIISSSDGRSDSATWTRTITGLPVYTTVNGTTKYYSYTVEEAPILGYTGAISYDTTSATTTAKIVNTPEPFEIKFKYYDRYEINGSPSGIEDTETVYTVTVNAIPQRYITYDNETGEVSSIDFAGLIGETAVEFSNTALSVANVMCDYDLWTSQSAAATAMSSRSYLVNGEPVPYNANEDETTYHTDYLGKPYNHTPYDGQAESKLEKWVNYYNSEDNTLEEDSLSTNNNFLNVKKIVVWCYNYPRQYNVNIYGANSADDLDQDAKTVGGSTVHVASATSEDNDVKYNGQFYYNQRFGEETGNEDQDHGGFIENYGLARFTDTPFF
ncbi:MAG: Cna B-type domain-containing protein [Ruminococcus sp.]|nr:Cna B-type domain-containing protein [Ruminococcus sp.]